MESTIIYMSLFIVPQARSKLFSVIWFISTRCIELLMGLQQRYTTRKQQSHQNLCGLSPIYWNLYVSLKSSGVHLQWQKRCEATNMSTPDMGLFGAHELILFVVFAEFTKLIALTSSPRSDEIFFPFQVAVSKL